MASTTVVIRGLAITAGSIPALRAAMGNRQPMSLEDTIVTTKDMATTRATTGS